jgi:hypothetical protein
VKLPAEIELFKNKAPNPPNSIITWGTWLDAIMYYTEKFEIFCFLVNELKTDDASCCNIARNV